MVVTQSPRAGTARVATLAHKHDELTGYKQGIRLTKHCAMPRTIDGRVLCGDAACGVVGSATACGPTLLLFEAVHSSPAASAASREGLLTHKLMEYTRHQGQGTVTDLTQAGVRLGTKPRSVESLEKLALKPMATPHLQTGGP